MNYKRVIPFLLITKDGLVKTTNFKNKRYIGDPINAVKIFNEKYADELAILDIDASKKGHEINFDFINQIISEAFMPISYGGGIKNIKDIERLFKIGVEKICLNSIVFENIEVIKEAIDIFGSQSIICSLDLKKNLFGKYYAFSHSGTKKQKITIKNLIKKVKDLGFGELIVNDINFEGKMKGYNLELIKEFSENLEIPVVALGGAGNYNDLKDAISIGASAVGVGSMFVYHGPLKAVLISYLSQEEIFELSSFN